MYSAGSIMGALRGAADVFFYGRLMNFYNDGETRLDGILSSGGKFVLAYRRGRVELEYFCIVKRHDGKCKRRRKLRRSGSVRDILVGMRYTLTMASV